jgi:hypothetical protein
VPVVQRHQEHSAKQYKYSTDNGGDLASHCLEGCVASPQTKLFRAVLQECRLKGRSNLYANYHESS